MSMVVDEPYDVLVPNSTCDEDTSLVLHEIVAEVPEILLVVTFEITGAVISDDADIVCETSLENALSFPEESYAVVA
ncbi:MAG: hypothetical protein AABY66_02235, partial [Nitrospirota bacterium]